MYPAATQKSSTQPDQHDVHGNKQACIGLVGFQLFWFGLVSLDLVYEFPALAKTVALARLRSF